MGNEPDDDAERRACADVSSSARIGAAALAIVLVVLLVLDVAVPDYHVSPAILLPRRPTDAESRRQIHFSEVAARGQLAVKDHLVELRQGPVRHRTSVRPLRTSLCQRLGQRVHAKRLPNWPRRTTRSYPVCRRHNGTSGGARGAKCGRTRCWHWDHQDRA